MKKKLLPPHTPENIKGRQYLDLIAAKAIIREKHEYTGPWAQAPQPIKAAAVKLAKKLYEGRNTTIQKRKKPEGPISFFDFATGKPVLE